MKKVLIIADDFTSVTDCGVHFSKNGVKTLALLKILGEEKSDKYEVLSVDTDSRPLSGQDSYCAMREVLEKLEIKNRRIYKSIDSLMRGNVGAEIDAILDYSDLKGAIIAPAFPKFGRTTKNGIHYLNGVELEKSEAKNDPACPAIMSNIKEMVEQQTDKKVYHLNLEEIRLDQKDFEILIKSLTKENYQLFTLDVETEADLSKIAENTCYLEEYLVAGSTGLSQYLANGWQMEKEEVDEQVSNIEGNKNIVIVSGSMAKITAGQIVNLEKEKNVETICIYPQRILENDISKDIEKGIEILQSKADLLIYLDNSSKAREYVKEIAREKGYDISCIAIQLAEKLSVIVEEILKNQEIGGLVLTGGDTAKAVCQQLNFTQFELLNEVETGIPIAKELNQTGIYVVTKSGSFGGEMALVNCLQTLKIR